MEFYLYKKKKDFLPGTEAEIFCLLTLNYEPDFDKFGGSLSLDDFNKFWTLLREKSKSSDESDVLPFHFATNLKFSKLLFGDSHENDLLLVGVEACKITKLLREIFGENEVKMQVEVRNIKQGKLLRQKWVTSRAMSVLKGTVYLERNLACTAWGPVSWFGNIDFYYCRAYPTGDLDVKLVITRKGLDNLASAFAKSREECDKKTSG